MTLRPPIPTALSSPSRRRALAAALRSVGAAGLSALLAPALFMSGCRRGQPEAGPGDGQVRIAACAPALALILRDLGLGGSLVARHAFDAWSDPALPPVLDQNGIDYPALLRALPTHVLTQWGDRPLPGPLVAMAADRGFVVHDFRFGPIDDVLLALDRLGAVFPRASAEAGAWRARIEAALVPVPGAAAAGRVLLLHSTDPPAALGPGSYHHELLQRLGVTPALAEGSRYMALHAADVLRLAPDAIIVLKPRSAAATPAPPGPQASPPDPASYLGVLAGLRVPALARRPMRVALIDDTDALIPGTNLARLASRVGESVRAFSAG